MEKSWKKSRKSHGMSWNLFLKIVWEPCTNHPCDLHQWSSWRSQTQSVCWWLQRWEPGLLCDSQQPWAASWPKLSSQLLLSLVECWHCCDWKSRTACAQSFSLWQQTTIEITWRDHSYCLFAPYIYIYILFFFAHILFVVNHTFNATPLEMLQQHPLLFTTNRTDRTCFLWRLNSAQPPHPGHSTILLQSEILCGMCANLRTGSKQQ